MPFRQCLLILGLCLLAVGCRRDPYRDAYFDILNAEKRVLEDRLYAAEDNYERALRDLESCRGRQGPAATTRQPVPRREEPPAPEPDLPDIELPPGFEGTRRGPARTVYPASLHRSGTGPSITLLAARDEPPSDDRPPVDRRIASIYLNPRRTGGLDLDGQPGDDGLSVLIEPRNELGQYVAEPGQISLVLLDPTRQGDAARFARWDFDREATARMLSASGLDRGLHVCVPWPESPPQADRLHLFVRYLGDSGQTLQADREVAIRSIGQLAERWTPRADAAGTQTAGRQGLSPNTDSGVIQASHPAPLAADRAAEQPSGPQPPSEGRSPQWRPQR